MYTLHVYMVLIFLAGVVFLRLHSLSPELVEQHDLFIMFLQSIPCLNAGPLLEP